MRRLTAELRRMPIRLKLTLVFAGAMGVLLLGLRLFLYFRFESGLDQTLDQQLHARASEVSLAQILDSDGRVVDSSVDDTPPLLTGEEIAAATHGPAP